MQPIYHRHKELEICTIPTAKFNTLHIQIFAQILLKIGGKNLTTSLAGCNQLTP